MTIDYSDLVLDVAAEIRGGMPSHIAISEVAEDMGASIEILAARFNRAYPDGVPAEIDMGAKVEEQVQRQCIRYNVPRSATVGPIFTKSNKRVIVICRIGKSVIAVDTKTASVWKIGGGAFSSAAIKLANSNA